MKAAAVVGVALTAMAGPFLGSGPAIAAGAAPGVAGVSVVRGAARAVIPATRAVTTASAAKAARMAAVPGSQVWVIWNGLADRVGLAKAQRSGGSAGSGADASGPPSDPPTWFHALRVEAAAASSSTTGTWRRPHCGVGWDCVPLRQRGQRRARRIGPSVTLLLNVTLAHLTN